MSIYASLKNGTDIRGIALEGIEGEHVNLDASIAEHFGYAFANWSSKKLNKKKLIIAVGYDSRISSPDLAEGVMKGIEAFGSSVIATGLSSTPSMFMLLKEKQPWADASVMITASHLPYNRNGIKFFSQDGGLESAELDEVIALAEQNVPSFSFNPVKETSYLRTYCHNLVSMVQKATGSERPLAGLHIVVDAGNGAGGFYANDVILPLGGNISGSQFLNPDGRFPNHIPNPENKAAMQSVIQAVLQNKADFGIIFDTDVDRAGAVSADGCEINRNRLIALISSILLREKPGTIVTDSVTSDGLTAFIEHHGGHHHRFKRGYKNVIDEAIRLNRNGEYTPLAIETSGHAALMENYFLDDGAYLITRLLILLSEAAKSGKNIMDLISDLPEPVEEAEFRPVFKDRSTFKEQGKELLSDYEQYVDSLPYAQKAPVNYEGVRVNFDKEHGNGWALIRMSLHDPILPINIESESKGGVEKIKDIIYNFLSRYPFLDLSVFLK